RHWVTEPARPQTEPIRASGPSLLHPLVHARAAAPSDRRFTTSLTGQEFFLADHLVRGQHLLPAVAYLEMARAAFALAGPLDPKGVLRIRNVTWAQPVVVEGAPVQVDVGLEQRPGPGTSFAITR